jgi:hypothetical protein
LHTDEPDAAQRLRFIHEDMARAPGMERAAPAGALIDLERFAPSAVAARSARLTTRTSVVNRAKSPFNLVVTNVPGPAAPLHVAGAVARRMLSLPPLVDGQGIGLSLQSYGDRIAVGVVTCRELVPDPARIVELLGSALHELEQLVDQSS